MCLASLEKGQLLTLSTGAWTYTAPIVLTQALQISFAIKDAQSRRASHCHSWKLASYTIVSCTCGQSSFRSLKALREWPQRLFIAMARFVHIPRFKKSFVLAKSLFTLSKVWRTDQIENCCLSSCSKLLLARSATFFLLCFFSCAQFLLLAKANRSAHRVDFFCKNSTTASPAHFPSARVTLTGCKVLFSKHAWERKWMPRHNQKQKSNFQLFLLAPKIRHLVPATKLLSVSKISSHATRAKSKSSSVLAKLTCRTDNLVSLKNIPSTHLLVWSSSFS